MGIGRVVFAIGGAGGAVKDIVRGNLNHGGTDGGGGFGEILRCGVVEEFAECFVALGFIDGGVGGAVDDDRHGVLFHEEVHGFSVGDVQFVFVGEEEPDVFVFLRCQFAQFTAQLSVASGDKNGFHIYNV